jgi:hypothetical protein
MLGLEGARKNGAKSRPLSFPKSTFVFRVLGQLRNKLGHNAALMQLPIGKESNFKVTQSIFYLKVVFTRTTVDWSL